jgi:hypothetical protein
MDEAGTGFAGMKNSPDAGMTLQGTFDTVSTAGEG